MLIISDTDSKAYKTSLSVAEELIGPIQLSLLKLSLSTHSLSPRVQAHFQIAEEVIYHGDCKTDSFVTLGSRVACDLAELKKGLEKLSESNDDDEEVYSFDHIYPGSENNTVTAILYSQIGTKDFKEFHEHLRAQAASGKVKYISRHYIRVSFCFCIFTIAQTRIVKQFLISFLQEQSSQRVRLSGYGVELHLKSTEYKSQDDSPRTEDRKSNEDQEDETEVEGFDFVKLK